METFEIEPREFRETPARVNPEPSLGNEEGATTIPKGSREQRSRSTWGPKGS